jgi:cyclic pyranopterin phosphate synthase
MLVDRWGRILDSLRISLTSFCNYSCIYCHREGFANRGNGLKPDEYRAIAYVATSLGIARFKLTGGEPLLRRDVVDVVKVFSEAKPDDLSMTTNGFYLEELAQKLVEAGLRRVNVNVPSLDRERYKRITKVDALDKVLKGLRAAHDAGLEPITINVTVLKNFNDAEFANLINFASQNGYRLRFIELEPISLPKPVFEELYASLNPVIDHLERVSVRKYIRKLHARPVYVLDTGIEVEIVRWTHNTAFCMGCTRVRLSADGVLLPCIMATKGVDLKPFLRPRIDMGRLRESFIAVNGMRFPYNLLLEKRGFNANKVVEI